MKTFLTILSFLFILNLSLLASVINVPADQPSIQAGINAATSGDTVLVADSTYYENINFIGKAITVASHFLIDGDSIHIDGTIIDGSQPSNPDSGSVVSFVSGEDTNSVLSGFTITNGTGTITFFGSVARSGGGIFCYNSGATIQSNKIINNSVSHNDANGGGIAVIATSIVFVNVLDNEIKNNVINGISGGAYGGGVFFGNSSGKLIGNVISNNSSNRSNGEANGGGVSLWSNLGQVPYVIVKENTITHNSSVSNSGTAHAGGIIINKTNIMMLNNDISYNTLFAATGSVAYGGGAFILFMEETSVINGNRFIGNIIETGNGHGGGLNLWEAKPEFKNNIIKNNSGVVNAGGIQLGTNSDVSIVNCIIANNSAGNFGGGIYSFDSSPSIINSTIINNNSTYGGGFHSYNSNSVVMNSIFWGNQATYGPGIRWYLGSMDVVFSDIQGGWSGTGNINTDPLFTYDGIHLSSASTCIGAGIDTWQIGGVWYDAPGEDFEDDPRPWPANSMPDMGADEHPFGSSTNAILVPGDYPTIQAGINAAVSGDTVLVADSTYFENINFKGKAITVASHFLIDDDTSHISATIIDGSQPSNPDSGSVVSFVSGEDTNSVLCGLTITNGTGTISSFSGTPGRYGGGIFCYNSGARIDSNKILNNSVAHNDGNGGGIGVNSASLVNVIIRGNEITNNIVNATTGSYGGGILLLNGSGEIINNSILNNSSICSGGQANGGGVLLYSSTSQPAFVKMKNNRVSYNSTSGIDIGLAPGAIGGGLFLWDCNALVQNNEIIYNTVSGTPNACGAGLYCSSVDDITIIDCNFISHNTAQITGWGGGVYFAFSNPHFINNIISNNSATNGGGIESVGSTNPAIINNTIINNIATYGGGIKSYSSDLRVINTIIWGNQAPNYPSISLNSGSINVVYSDVEGGWPGEGNIDSDPLFADSLFYELSETSPCVGAGTDSLAPPFDYDGDPRPNPVDEYVDIGAQESPYANPTGIVKEHSKYLPKTFSLKQNYPNPFNPSTTIEFALPKTEFVTLKVYNILGQEVATLLSENLNPGEYKYVWNASAYATGVYYYKIEAGDPSTGSPSTSTGQAGQRFVQTKKLLLIK